ncbi:MAG: electron transfer flavoprotein subunit beta/FixA family protein [Chloroflexi bacterium]|nr:electron transfer flavoprotein subunit beta/FixA family protein [Chloroflexota bacterium]
MNIVVCVKEVPNPTFPVEVDIQKNAVKSEEWNYVINPYDEVALEEAVRIKEKFGGQVTVITLGAERAGAILRKCLCIGADRAILIPSDSAFAWDGFAIANVLSKAISRLPHDIVLCGYQSIDRGGAEVGSIIAELLGLPVVTAVVKLDIAPDGKSATVCRRLERGARAVKRSPLPALFTADLMLNEPRYPTLPCIKWALKQEIEKLDVKSLGVEAGPLTEFVTISRPPPKKVFIPTGALSPAERIKLLTGGGAAKKSSSNIVEGAPHEVAKKVVDFLAEKRFLL